MGELELGHLERPEHRLFPWLQFPLQGSTGTAWWPNGLALGDLPWIEQVELDFPHDVGDAGLAGFPGGEVAGFLRFSGAVAVKVVADGESGQEDLQQERGEGEFWLVIRGKAATESFAAARARGNLICAGGTPASLTAIPTILHIAW